MKQAAVNIILLLSGTILLLIGLSILFLPHAFYESNGTLLGDRPGLLSEVRASGALLLGCGVFIFSSLFRPAFRRSAMGLSTLVYLAYGIARLGSMVFDGVPSQSLVISAGIELLIGIVCAASLVLFWGGKMQVRQGSAS